MNNEVRKKVDTIKRTVERANSEGYSVTEHALRNWIKQGVIPVKKAGTRALVYYPNLIEFLTCEDGLQDNSPPPAEEDGFSLRPRTLRGAR